MTSKKPQIPSPDILGEVCERNGIEITGFTPTQMFVQRQFRQIISTIWRTEQTTPALGNKWKENTIAYWSQRATEYIDNLKAIA